MKSSREIKRVKSFWSAAHPHFPRASTTRKPMVFRRVSGGTGMRAEARSSSWEAERQLPPRVVPRTGFAGSPGLAGMTGV